MEGRSGVVDGRRRYDDRFEESMAVLRLLHYVDSKRAVATTKLYGIKYFIVKVPCCRAQRVPTEVRLDFK